MDTSTPPSNTSAAADEKIQSTSEVENKGEILSPPDFMYTHNGHPISPDMTVDDVGVEDGDIIVAVELVDLTESVVRFLLAMHQSCHTGIPYPKCRTMIWCLCLSAIA